MRAPRLFATLVIAVVAGVLLAACGTSAGTTTTVSPATTAGGGQYQVTIDGFAFTPAELSVPVGATVSWTNSHAANHTVTSDSGVFDSGTMAQGATFSFTFTQAGEFPYRCSIHSSMTGKIVVAG